MSRLLLDTQILLWAVDQPDRLPGAAAELLEDRAHQVYFSLVSVWEASIKFALGRADFTIPPRILRDSLVRSGFLEMPITCEHVIAVSQLPNLHHDPFDRLLVAQAKVEGLMLMTADKTLAQYGPHVKRFR